MANPPGWECGDAAGTDWSSHCNSPVSYPPSGSWINSGGQDPAYWESGCYNCITYVYQSYGQANRTYCVSGLPPAPIPPCSGWQGEYKSFSDAYSDALLDAIAHFNANYSSYYDEFYSLDYIIDECCDGCVSGNDEYASCQLIVSGYTVRHHGSP